MVEECSEVHSHFCVLNTILVHAMSNGVVLYVTLS